MPVAPDIQAAEDRAIVLFRDLFQTLRDTQDPKDLAALVDKMNALNILLTLVYKVEDQRAKRS